MEQNIQTQELSESSESAPLVITDKVLTRPEIINAAVRYLPVTREGLLAGFFRPDMLPISATALEALHPKTTSNAIIPLSYTEGFPTLPDGRPFWHKLDFESAEAFACFEVYVSLANNGPRHLAAMLDSAEVVHLLTPYANTVSEYSNPNTHPNSLSAVASLLPILQEYYTLFFWKDRARAYDLYKEAAYRHIRTRRALSADDTNYTKSTLLIDNIYNMLQSPDALENLKYEPDKLIAMLEKLVRIQRVSVGMPATAPIEAQKEMAPNQAPATFEYFMRRVTQSAEANTDQSQVGMGMGHSNQHGTTFDEAGKVVPTTDNLLRGALNDPNTARMLQEVIIKVSTQQGATRKPRWYRGEVVDDENDYDTPDDTQ